jgi:hypothetical protein
MESRGGKFSETNSFTTQIFLKTYLDGIAIIKEDVDEAEAYLGVN